MRNSDRIREIYRNCIRMCVGFMGTEPAGGTTVKGSKDLYCNTIYAFYKNATLPQIDQQHSPPAAENKDHIDEILLKTLTDEAVTAEENFISYYSKPEQYLFLLSQWENILSSEDAETRAEQLMQIWLPELHISDKEILKQWHVDLLKENPNPLQPTEVILQLNALYTLSEQQQTAFNSGKQHFTHIADYDHPVPMYAADEEHELVNCLIELEADIAYEKKKEVLPQEHKVPVLISVSVTHREIDEECSLWLHERIRHMALKHLDCYIINEAAIIKIKTELLSRDYPVFTVLGKYAAHFNALKYLQLLFETAYGYRAGFKLDTDEGIRTQELRETTGKTWLETLCHPYWGGSAIDTAGNTVSLGINEGEYINSTDIDKLGYPHALRCPDVSFPATSIGPSIFFSKGAAHARATALYNRFHHVEDGISHPVVKGGGYGITNEALRTCAPLTFSGTGRAEDQQFYFTALSAGCRGIFHPDLRIAHYKSSVSGSEKKTATSRFLGDIYRLVLFSHLISILAIKHKLNPMPGVFGSDLSCVQSLFTLVYTAYTMLQDGNQTAGKTILTQGIREIQQLKENIQNGTIKKQFKQEQTEWKNLIAELNGLPKGKTADVLNCIKIKKYDT